MERVYVPGPGRETGVVVWFSRMKGWGFVSRANGTGDAFLHRLKIVGGIDLYKGDRVEFSVERKPDGKFMATGVVRIGGE